MINPKNICYCSCIGFFLSFFIGLVSGVSFSHVLIRALIFAPLFGVMCIGITFVYQKFLSNESNGFSVDGDVAPSRPVGGVVNIVVDDTNLVDEGMSPKFTIATNHADLHEKRTEPPVYRPEPEVSEPVLEPGAAENPAAAPSSPAQESSFKPVTLGSASGESAAQPSVSDSPAPHASPAASAPSGEESLDELPDIGSMGIEEASGGTASELDSPAEVVTDTEFATGGSKMKEQPVSGDTNVMAKAIQTLLAQDNN